MKPEEIQALVRVGHGLARRGYHFIAVTPETHRRVNTRAERSGAELGRDLRDVFGWNRPFEPGLLPSALLSDLRAANACDEEEGKLRSTVRFASLGEKLFAHSAFPTQAEDSVFFGPDSYRFCALLARHAPTGGRMVDVGTGTGVAGLVVAGQFDSVVLADVNQRALAFARVNAELAGVDATVVESDVLDAVPGEFDLVAANPPYMIDPLGRTYRDGGGAHGEALAARIVREGLFRLRPGGCLIVYTGSAIVDGHDTFRRAIAPALSQAGARFEYEELDPDVFGEELERPVYARVERIAAVALRAWRG